MHLAGCLQSLIAFFPICPFTCSVSFPTPLCFLSLFFLLLFPLGQNQDHPGSFQEKVLEKSIWY